MIEFDEVCRSFGSFQALEGLTLGVRPGRIYALLGPNGAGKTTALRIAMGLTRATGGRVHLGAIDVSESPVEARAVAGFLPDRPSFYPHQTGRGFLDFVARVRGLEEDLFVPRREKLLERLGLLEAADRLLSTFSFGMTRKIALAAAMIHAPAHLLLDEPTAGLDPWSVRVLKDLMLEEAARGAALLVSSHDLDAVAEVADRVGILHGGRLLQEVEPASVPARRSDGSSPLEELFLEVTGRGLDPSP